MRIEDSTVIAAPPERIYALAARIERWPELLPHYRWVRVLRELDAGERLVEMAASRDGFPVKWASIQRCDPARYRIYFRHVRGISRGMEVEWSMEPAQDGRAGDYAAHHPRFQGDADRPPTLVRIVHEFDPPWPRPMGPLFARYVVGDLFVHNVAAKTLRYVKRLAEGTGEAEQASAAEGEMGGDADGQDAGGPRTRGRQDARAPRMTEARD